MKCLTGWNCYIYIAGIITIETFHLCDMTVHNMTEYDTSRVGPGTTGRQGYTGGGLVPGPGPGHQCHHTTPLSIIVITTLLILITVLTTSLMIQMIKLLIKVNPEDNGTGQ